MNDQAIQTSVAHEQIRTTADHKDGQPILLSEMNQLGECTDGGGLTPKSRRPSDPQSGMFRERLVKRESRFVTGERAQVFKNAEVNRKLPGRLVNISRAKREHHVAGLEARTDPVNETAD